MRAYRRRVLLIGSLFLAVSAAAAPPARQPGHHPPWGSPISLAIVDVHVIPMDRERVLRHQTVLIRQGTIARIGPVRRVRVPRGAARIEGRGRYLMPGLADMHVHLLSRTELPLYVARGVTTVFNLDGRPAHLRWREEITRGRLLGPTVYTCGPKFDRARSAAEAIHEVFAQKRAGYDGVKIYNGVSREEYPPLVATARRLGMPVVGHVPRQPGFQAMLKAGQSIAHAEEYVYTFFNATGDIDRIQLDERRIPEAAAATRAAGVWVIPTLVTYDQIRQQAGDLDSFLARPEIRYLSPALRDALSPENNLYRRAFTPRQIPRLAACLAFQKKLVRALHAAGVPLLAGTDAMGIGPVAGFALHEELANLVSCGLTPFQALRAALAYLDANDPFHQLSSWVLTSLCLSEGAERLRQVIQQVRREQPDAALVQERTINRLGYNLLRRKRNETAIEIFRLNVEIHPKSANVYDSLAEAYLSSGDRQRAAQYYRKALEVDPRYPNAPAARDALKKLAP